MLKSKNVGVCGNCQGEDLDYKSFVHQSDGGYYSFKCNSCGTTGDEFYDLVYSETIMKEYSLEGVMTLFRRKINCLNLDERDNYPDFAEMVKKAFPNKGYDVELYQDMKNCADDCVEKAEALATAYRRAENREDLGKSQDAFDAAQENLHF